MKLRATLICLSLSASPAAAYEREIAHFLIGVSTAYVTEQSLKRFSPTLTRKQTTWRTFRNCLLVAGGVEIFQEISGTGIGDPEDVAVTAAGCLAVKYTIDFNKWLRR